MPERDGEGKWDEELEKRRNRKGVGKRVRRKSRERGEVRSWERGGAGGRRRQEEQNLEMRGLERKEDPEKVCV